MSPAGSVNASLICRSGLEDGALVERTVQIDGTSESIIVHRDGNTLRAWRNACPHQGRRLDYVPGRFLLVDLAGWIPAPAKVLLFIMSIDCVEYWMHRLGHANKLYWKFHCIHHTPEQLTPLSKFRVHWVDMTVFGTVKALPLMILGHVDAMWMPYLPLMLLQVFSHFDIDFHYGPVLGRFLVSPRYHRVHHSANELSRTNFGGTFSIWDRAFGTYTDPRTVPADMPLGLGEHVPRRKIPRMLLGV